MKLNIYIYTHTHTHTHTQNTIFFYITSLKLCNW